MAECGWSWDFFLLGNMASWNPYQLVAASQIAGLWFSSEPNPTGQAVPGIVGNHDNIRGELLGQQTLGFPAFACSRVTEHSPERPVYINRNSGSLGNWNTETSKFSFMILLTFLSKLKNKTKPFIEC